MKKRATESNSEDCRQEAQNSQEGIGVLAFSRFDGVSPHQNMYKFFNMNILQKIPLLSRSSLVKLGQTSSNGCKCLDRVAKTQRESGFCRFYRGNIQTSRGQSRLATPILKHFNFGRTQRRARSSRSRCGASRAALPGKAVLAETPNAARETHALPVPKIMIGRNPKSGLAPVFSSPIVAAN